VSVCWPGCYDDSLDDVNPDYWQANTSLKIVAPVVEVPNVRCLRVREATARLRQAGFSALVDRGKGDVVTDQDPQPGAEVQQPVRVTLLLDPVPVPDALGSTYDEARVMLEERCLAIAPVDGITDGAVERQGPGRAVVVPGGTTVNVTMSGSTPPTPTEPTPTEPTPTQPTPTQPTPTRPTPTPPVTNESGPDQDTGPVSFPAAGSAPALALLVALLLAAMFAAGLLTRAIRRHREAAWVTAHVTVTPRPGPGATFEIRSRDPHNDDHVISVVAVEVTRSTTVEESPA